MSLQYPSYPRLRFLGLVVVALAFFTACDGYREVVTLENSQLNVFVSSTVICSDDLLIEVAGQEPCENLSTGSDLAATPLLAAAALSEADLTIKGDLDRRFVTIEADDVDRTYWRLR